MYFHWNIQQIIHIFIILIQDEKEFHIQLFYYLKLFATNCLFNFKSKFSEICSIFVKKKWLKDKKYLYFEKIENLNNRILKKYIEINNGCDKSVILSVYYLIIISFLSFSYNYHFPF